MDLNTDWWGLVTKSLVAILWYVQFSNAVNLEYSDFRIQLCVTLFKTNIVNQESKILYGSNDAIPNDERELPKSQWPFLMTWINSNHSVDKLYHTHLGVWWNYVSIPKRQRYTPLKFGNI